MIQKIKLNSFRNFKTKEVTFSDGITLILGPNASGKTNILESLYLLSTGKSFKARVEEEMINYKSNLSRISGVLPGATTLEAVITRGYIDIGAARPEKAPKKRLLVNGIPKRMVDFAGNFKTVLFGPWDMDLVTESPSIRRRFLDNVLSQVDREYRRSILSYEKGLRQRNRVLWGIREGNISRDRLVFWDQLLIKNGDYVTKKRQELIEFINNHHSLSPNSYSISYDSSVISQGRLDQYKYEEVSSATTLVGPHRDDFIFFKSITGRTGSAGRELAAYGSRGEQRMGVLWLKMAELSYIEEKNIEAGAETSSARPTLLLDDIFSELDEEHRELAMKVATEQQTIITSVNDEFTKELKKVDRIDLIG